MARQTVVHQIDQHAFAGAAHDDGILADAAGGELLAVEIVEHPRHHRPCHLRKARQKMMMIEAETGNAVVGVGNDAAAERKLAHLQALRRDVGAEARADFRVGIRMQFQHHAGGIGGALARVIVRRGADAAEAENDILRRQRAFQRRGDQRRFVGQILAPRQLEPALAQRRNDRRHVLVLPLAGHDFVADDDGTKLHFRSRSVCLKKIRASREYTIRAVRSRTAVRKSSP